MSTTDTSRPKGGRPRDPHAMRARINVRCSREQLAQWRAAAADLGVSIGDYIRAAVDRAVRRG